MSRLRILELMVQVSVAVGGNWPVVVIGAVEDRITPAAMVRQMARKYGAQYRAFQGHGHMIVLGPVWEKVARKVEEWVGKVVGA